MPRSTALPIAGKPVVVLKVGRTERSRRAITSHTGGLAGESRVFSEVLRAHRAIEVEDMDELTEVLAVCQGGALADGPAPLRSSPPRAARPS